jgi:hypothetical protein
MAPLRAAIAALLLGVPLPVATPSAAEAPVEYGPVAVAPVVDPFRPPAEPWGPGNRGLELATVPGQEVVAAADGEVTFAGAVAGALHVTVRHADGTLTTASFLASVEVAPGAAVRRGQRLGRAGPRVHVGARVDGAYVDPAGLLGTHERVVRLVATDTEPARARLAERAHLAAVARLEGGGPGPVAAVAGAAARVVGAGLGAGGDVLGHVAAAAHDLAGGGRWLVDRGIDTATWLTTTTAGRLDALLTGLVELSPVVRYWRLAERFRSWAASRRACTSGPSAPVPAAATGEPGGRRVAVLVAGLGSSSHDAAVGRVDTAGLGYADGDVVGFSYAGGRTPERFGTGAGPPAADLAQLATSSYGPDDSATDLVARGRHLADLLEAVAARTGGATVDLLAHSQGGVVARLALAELESRPGGAEVIARLGLVATIGSPHGAADLATVADRLGGTAVGAAVLGAVDDVTGRPLDPGSTTVGDLAEGSLLLAALADRPLPAGPHYLSIGGRGDLVVPSARTALPGAHHVVVGAVGLHAHDRLPGDPATTRELALGLAGRPPGCRGLLDAAGDALWAEGIGQVVVRAGLVLGAVLGW